MKWSIFLLLMLSFSPIYGQITYMQDIAPILKKHCVSCHSQGDIGPMSLTTYDEVASYASMIKFVTDTKLMPPFKADIHKVSYTNERSVSEEEKEKIAKWIEGGLEKGTVISTIEPKTKTDPVTYDYTVCMEEAFEHYGIYYDQYQAFVLPIDINEIKYVKDIHFEPGNKEIVRSANISIAPKGASAKIDNWDPRYGFFVYGSLGFTPSFPNWYNWMPHTPAINLEGTDCLLLPTDSELIMHIHYGPFGEIQKDSSCIHFNFDEVSSPINQNVPLVKTEFLKDTFRLEKGKKTRISSSFILPVSTQLQSITPLSHLLCRSWEVFAVLPDKTSISLLSIDDWDFHWKEKYTFSEEIVLPPGTKVVATAIYDNTSSNPYNPASPPHTMNKGPHMYDENFECYFEFSPSKSTAGYFSKPFHLSSKALKEINFQINNPDSITIAVHNLDTNSQEVISSKNYDKGLHTIQSTKLPSRAGRYCLTLESNEGLLDSWWFVII